MDHPFTFEASTFSCYWSNTDKRRGLLIGDITEFRDVTDDESKLRIFSYA